MDGGRGMEGAVGMGEGGGRAPMVPMGGRGGNPNPNPNGGIRDPPIASGVTVGGWDGGPPSF